jgi:peptidoglycan/xylan/chitin deacetylase (PgdA/CDA1 family)
MAKGKLKTKPIIIVAVILIVLIVGGLLVLSYTSLKISVNDKKDVYEINVNSTTYDGADVKCTFFGGNEKVKADKTIDTSKLGNVEVTYSCSKLFFTKSVKVKYSVIDKEAPVIKLKGKEYNVVYDGSTYEEAGYTATDNADGDLTSKVVVDTSKVDYKAIGNYKITYTVKDKTGNEAKEEREILYRNTSGTGMICGEEGTIYLTFDDGPNKGTTNNILDILKKYDVKATFFVMGKAADANQDLLKREADEGHAIGIHTYTHDYSQVYKSTTNFWNEIDKTQELIKKVTGKETNLIRFPGGSSNTVSKHYKIGIMKTLTKEVEEKGFSYVDWNIVSGDAGDLKSSTLEGQVKEEISNVTSGLSKAKGNIVLMHDIKQTTSNAIESIIKYGKDNGYKFDVLTRDTTICHQRVWN